MTNPTAKRHPTFTTDSDGVRIARIPLARGGEAIIELADWEMLQRRGFSSNWTLNDNGHGHAYVRAHGLDNLETVARVLMQPPPGFCVRYRNGDRRDLRRSNLRLERRTAVTQQRAA